MKRKKQYALLGCEAVLIGTLVLLTDRFPALVSSLPAFPFAQLSLGIAAIARVGNLGNGLAVALWAGISLLPAVIALRKDPAMSVGERISLFFLSAVLFAALYGTCGHHRFPGRGERGTATVSSASVPGRHRCGVSPDQHCVHPDSPAAFQTSGGEQAAPGGQ